MRLNRILWGVVLALAFLLLVDRMKGQKINGSRVIEGTVNYCADAGGTDAYACSLNPSIIGYVTGALYQFKANTTNTGGATINLNALGAKTILMNNDQSLADGTIEAGQIVTVVYDGTNMQMLSQSAAAAAGSGVTSATGTANQIAVSAATGAVTWSIPSSPTLPGTTTGTFSGPLTGNVTGNVSGNAATATTASTATALVANGGNCTAGQFPLGVDASGAVETCTALPTTIAGTANQVAASAATGAITLSIPTNPTLPGTTTGTFSGALTGNATTATNLAAATPFYVAYKAAVCQNATASLGFSTPTSNPAVAACVTGSNTQLGVAQFADGSNLSVQDHIYLPPDWTGAVDVKFKWRTSATSGNVVWQVATACVADAETVDPAFNTASTVTDTAKGTTLQTNDAQITGLTTTGCAAEEQMFFKILRDSAHGSDTLAATADLIGATFVIRRTI